MTGGLGGLVAPPVAVGLVVTVVHGFPSVVVSGQYVVVMVTPSVTMVVVIQMEDS